MSIEVCEEPITTLAEYASIPIAFEVNRIFAVTVPNNITAEAVLTERLLEHPYIKDYDLVENPLTWPTRFDMSKWSMFVARINGRRVGGAIVGFDRPDTNMIENSQGIAVLWDIRVAPEARASGVGSALFRAAENLARMKGYRRLKVETQNINVPACRFYLRQGCTIGSVDRYAYPELPNEIQLMWYKDLPPT
jgi:ribosomal protein S18 acetylase RimI-like enzyme